jgi:hypothetical protein
MGRIINRALRRACVAACCAAFAWALLRFWDVTPARAALAGTVRARAQPIAGANVCAACATCGSRDALTCAVSDEAGRYALSALEPGNYRLSAAARGHAAAAWKDGELARVEPNDGERRFDIALNIEAARISGLVRDTSGSPIANARLRVVRPERPRLLLEIVSDAQGAFDVALPKGPFELSANAPGHAPATLYGVAPTSSADLELRPALELRGRAVHAASGEAITSATVRAISHDTIPRVATVHSDAEGRFVFADLAAGHYLITVSGESAYGELAGVDVEASSSGIVVEGHLGFALRGRVLLDDGTPCPEGYVLLGEPDPSRPLSAEDEAAAERSEGTFGPEQYAVIERDGVVRLPGVPAATYFASPQCPGYALKSGHARIELPRDAERELIWTMTPATRLEARAVDKRGAPVADARIAISWPGRGGRRVVSPAVTGDDGSVELSGPACGDCKLMAADNLDASRAIAFDVTADGRHGQATLTLDGDATLEVEVRDPRGAPVDRLTVFARALGVTRDKRLATALGAGRYRVPAVPAGSYVVYADDGASDARPLWGSEQMPIRVDEGASLRELCTLPALEAASNVLHLTGEVSIKETRKHD